MIFERSSKLSDFKHSAKRAAVGLAAGRILNNLRKKKDKRPSYLKLYKKAEKMFLQNVLPAETVEKIHASITDPNNRWFNMIDEM